MRDYKGTSAAKIERANRVLRNRVVSYFVRLYGDEMEAASPVVRAIIDEHYAIAEGEITGLSPDVTPLLDAVRRGIPQTEEA
jgi:hypothetical protein